VGASGGLGAVLVQLARAAGARVIGAARGQPKLDLAREAGAGLVVDDSEPDWPGQVTEATEGNGADLVFDNVGGPVGLAAFGAIAAGGRFSAHGAPAGGFADIDPQAAKRLGVTVRGLIRPIIGQTFPLEQAADAHRAIEARDVIGKTLLVT
jgi:NADPH2:quinone reductase